MPSNSILVQKQQLVADLAEQIKNSTAGVVVNYQGITVDKDTTMRKALRQAGVKYVVIQTQVGFGRVSLNETKVLGKSVVVNQTTNRRLDDTGNFQFTRLFIATYFCRTNERFAFFVFDRTLVGQRQIFKFTFGKLDNTL